DPHQLPISEDHPMNPLSPYAASKVAGERYCKAFARSYGLDTTCLRLFNVYGLKQGNGEHGGVINKFVERLSENLPPVIYGDAADWISTSIATRGRTEPFSR